MTTSTRVTVVGAGVFGLTAALELARRGHAVTVLDEGPVPHPLAASTDISKIVRMEYGVDALYTALAERSLEGWRAWNDRFARPLFHETGVAFLASRPLDDGGFEADSLRTIVARGHRPERLVRDAVTRRFPAWREGRWADGFFHARGGWVESGEVVVALAAWCRAAGVAVREGARVTALEGRRVVVEGEAVESDAVVLAAGAWTPWWLPELGGFLRASGHPVFHLRPARPERFAAPAFPVFGAAIAETGWYGFPLHPRAGVVKVARHHQGRTLHPEDPARGVTDDDLSALRAFLADALPELADAPVVATRECLYCDTADGDLLVARHPARDGLVVAAGDSGHAFKFAPALGELVADAVEGRPGEARFAWRTGAAGLGDAARANVT